MLSLGYVSDGKKLYNVNIFKTKKLHKENLSYHSYKICHKD